MKLRLLTVVVLFLSGGLLLPSRALGIAGKDRVAAKGQEARAIPGWPEGVLELINDPVRANGWHSWFSECPNDKYYYEMDVRRPEEVNRLIGILASIRAEAVQVRLDPAEGAAHAGGVGAIFSLGNQSIMNRWFQRLPEVEPGIRQFGVHRYRKPPAVLPPTLTLYVGHKAVDLEKLTIPPNVDVAAPNAASYRAKQKDAFQAIDAFIERHKTNQKGAGKAEAVEK